MSDLLRRGLPRGMTRAAARAAAGAAVAMAAGLSLGGVARAAHAAGVERSAPVRIASSAVQWSATHLPAAWTRLVTSLHGTGPIFAQLALIAALVVGVAAGIRALVLWRRTRPTLGTPGQAETPAVKKRAAHRAAGRSASAVAPRVQALAARGASTAGIARSTGLSQDAVALALALAR